MFAGEGGECLVVVDQPLAPGLEPAVARRRLRGGAFELAEPAADRRRIELAHQAADVLHLPALRFVALDPLCFEQRGEQLRVKRHRLQLRLRKRGERAAQRLKLVHFALLARLADNFLIHAIIIAPPCRSATDSAASAASCRSSRKPCSSGRGAPARAAAIATCPRAMASPSRCAKAAPIRSS